MHTPTPWEIEVRSGDTFIFAGPVVVAEVFDETGRQCHDAAMIIRAVNCHAKLVAALASILNSENGKTPSGRSIQAEAMDALAKAKA